MTGQTHASPVPFSPPTREESERLLSTRVEEIAGDLEDKIIHGRIRPGTILRQETLSNEYQVSRTPIREALRLLAAEELVEFIPRRGARVRELGIPELREAYLIRAELEGLAAERAATRVTDSDLEQMVIAEDRFASATHTLLRSPVPDLRLQIEWAEANNAFHDVILLAADAPMLMRMAQAARRVYRGQIVWANDPAIEELYDNNLGQHRALRMALAARSAHGARELARDHVKSSLALLETILDRITPASDAG